jgi:hypothetical protein
MDGFDQRKTMPTLKQGGTRGNRHILTLPYYLKSGIWMDLNKGRPCPGLSIYFWNSFSFYSTLFYFLDTI